MLQIRNGLSFHLHNHGNLRRQKIPRRRYQYQQRGTVSIYNISGKREIDTGTSERLTQMDLQEVPTKENYIAWF